MGLCMVAHACDLSPWETAAEDQVHLSRPFSVTQVWGQPERHETLSA